jgi:hypothetical protein
LDGKTQPGIYIGRRVRPTEMVAAGKMLAAGKLKIWRKYCKLRLYMEVMEELAKAPKEVLSIIVSRSGPGLAGTVLIGVRENVS